MEYWTRTSFLRTVAAGAAAAGGSLRFLAPSAASAQAAAAGATIASYVGEKMLSGALGSVGGAALGKIVASLGIGGPSLSDVLNQLSQISAQLEALQKSLAALESSLNKQLADLSYEVAFGDNTQPLIDKNARLLELYRALLAPGGLDEPGRQNRLDEIHYVLVDIDYSDGVRGWRAKLCGNPQAGTKGLIELWGRAVQARNAGLLNPATAKAIQDHFDYFDGQLAITAMFNVELFRANGQEPEALGVISSWADTRNALLGLVRGGSRSVDQCYVLKSGSAQLQTTTVSALPPKAIFPQATGQLYYSVLDGPVQLSYTSNGHTINSLSWLHDQMNQQLARAVLETGLGPQGRWHRISAKEFTVLVNALPDGHIGDNADHFVAALQRAGFEFPEQGDPNHVMTDIWYQHCYNCDAGFPVDYSRAAIYNEGGGWDTTGQGPNARGLLPLLVFSSPPSAPVTFYWT